MRILAFSSMLLLLAVSSGRMPQYSAPSGWMESQEKSTNPTGFEHVWTRNGERLRWFVSFWPIGFANSEEALRRVVTASAQLMGEQSVIDSVSAGPRCPGATQSWVVRYRTRLNIIAVFENTAQRGSVLTYAFHPHDAPDDAVTRGMLEYCIPVPQPQVDPTPIPATPLRVNDSLATASKNAASLGHFSYTPPVGWTLRASDRRLRNEPNTGTSESLTWERGDDAIFLIVLEHSQRPLHALSAETVKESLKKISDGMSVVMSHGCAGREVAVAELRRYVPSQTDVFGTNPEYYTDVFMNGTDNRAQLVYRHAMPHGDSAVMDSLKSLCFDPSILATQSPKTQRFSKG